ncbi:mitochondrial import inner membrane translocase subunit Tim21 [Microthyrium microscopicum]|uniref:Mitochondrial import inner membrane translocase subunit Tim21 n=1 Tax=Microthyrium microscopicum TaxID=703497 RepID=A0A6A6TVL2_9PEZI|nr:mitochondrial import inner membrane translocase subunit Tim21 [Microthyrium microscopicum]
MSLLRIRLPRPSVLNPTTYSTASIVPITRTIRHASNTSSHRKVTVLNDDGRVQWTALSAREKAARTTQQTVNLAVITVGMLLTGAVAYLLFSDVFSPNSKTSNFNRAVNRVKKSSRCIQLLGPADSIMAYGESPWGSFARARMAGPAPSSKVGKDEKTGVSTLNMRFLVKGSRAEGWVTLQMEKGPEDLEFEYVLLALDVHGHNRVYLEGTNGGLSRKKSQGKILGLKLW